MAAVEEPEARSGAAGACVLVVLGGAVVGVAFAVDEAAGVLLVVVAGGVALWRSARRRMSDSSATPPPGEERPSCRECAGHELVSVTPLEGQKGMLIYVTADPDRPNYSHTHLSPGVNDR
ncbi:hypothetical protein [Streptomyces shenzhenensis]|uniref:Uncharacterized protein n=1 Tax=Streptomyces shenzhenensis TaxID=943815 RepID=A0A3M0I3F6_9ACTN|nr:hypothetical protein [Streptomyces shenzhenensis]RMB81293.1 hypothetical protein CTZ28_35420 [Streptomyces shenzhenensis]